MKIAAGCVLVLFAFLRMAGGAYNGDEPLEPQEAILLVGGLAFVLY